MYTTSILTVMLFGNIVITIIVFKLGEVMHILCAFCVRFL